MQKRLRRLAKNASAQKGHGWEQDRVKKKGEQTK